MSDDIDQLARDYAAARSVLADRVQALQDEIEAAKRRRLRGIRKAVQAAQASRDRLAAAVEQHPEQFQRPKTRTLHGVKVGYQKAKGKIRIDDPERVVRLIRKHYPDQADALIQTKEVPVKQALNQLSAAELRKLGVTVEDDGEQIVVRPTDTDVDKLVDQLISQAELEEDAA